MVVKVLVCTTPKALENEIAEYLNADFRLEGAVTVGKNNQGNCIFVATMIKLPYPAVKDE